MADKQRKIEAHKLKRLPTLRDKKGRFTKGWCLNSQKDKNAAYPRYYTGPFRNQYVHRVQAAIKLQRELKKDEDVHHINRNKLDFRKRNLQVLGHQEHGWLTSKQRYYMTHIREKQEREWYEEYGIDTGNSTIDDSYVSDTSFPYQA